MCWAFSGQMCTLGCLILKSARQARARVQSGAASALRCMSETSITSMLRLYQLNSYHLGGVRRHGPSMAAMNCPMMKVSPQHRTGCMINGVAVKRQVAVFTCQLQLEPLQLYLPVQGHPCGS